MTVIWTYLQNGLSIRFRCDISEATLRYGAFHQGKEGPWLMNSPLAYELSMKEILLRSPGRRGQVQVSIIPQFSIPYLILSTYLIGLTLNISQTSR